MAKRKKVKIFEGLKKALEEMAAYERGEPIALRVTELPDPPPTKHRRTPATKGKLKSKLQP